MDRKRIYEHISSFYNGIHLKLQLNDYITYLRAHKHPTVMTLTTYEQALKYMNNPEIDTENLPDLYKFLLKALPEKGYVRVSLYLAIVSAWLKRNGIPFIKEINYYTLHDEIQKLKGTREAYTDSDINWLFAASTRNADLTKLLILMLYSGLRIGACYPIKYADFEKVPEHNVWTYEVFSKGVKYNAIISPKAFEALNVLKGPSQELVVQHDEGYSAPFDKRYRDMLSDAIRRDNLFHLREGKSIFHSLRKAYSQKLLASPLNPTDYTYKVLMGHIPKNSTATKYYIVAGKKVPLELVKRCAEAYEKTPLMTMEVGLH